MMARNNLNRKNNYQMLNQLKNSLLNNELENIANDDIANFYESCPKCLLNVASSEVAFLTK